ncbi:hypothetical protein AM501_03285 [Aneurinibacillus migulanus]|jgi:hypothetical protein|uniref:Sporulation membrane protein YtrI C-terminal domain-containing protein n=1 Tax=Aneurinibacillus migulanus TaxID=47500 RepID=A0A0D1UV43_ANEMI|nr:hypothetical protein [Aneurinibacillus migulanus]KIV50735.1 hypothetical protein TS65_29340 [Aneurinibacillus migulanus]KIV50904.1 hypothetical protein TS64_25420 [Aneurinibacillus migulanus]KON99340.1 hypothetical protein AF333_01005 [Aneurinibacillus migulanus]KPD09646.1 hypothetical protein AM501_03285 [Aneurinibacillus migulanus]MCP1354946.1 hypothetical protein [Aneurinibacillus migulanus]
MRVPSGVYWRRSIRFILLYILGILTGMGVFLLIVGDEVDRLHLKIRKLEQENIEYVQENIEYKKIENSLIQKEKNVVKEIELHLQTKDGFVEAELRKKLIKDLFFLKGKPLEYVAGFHEGIMMMVAERTYTIDNRIYSLHLSTLVISPSLHMYIRVEETR